MITQYEAVAEIEAMKWRRVRAPRERKRPAPAAAETPGTWDGASEAAIRREMERRLARRAEAKGH